LQKEVEAIFNHITRITQLRVSKFVLPIGALLIAMISLQSGASLAKGLFPLVGAPGVTSLRLGIGAFILLFIFKPWRMRFPRGDRMALFLYAFALGGMNFLFYFSLKKLPLGVAVALEFTGPLAVVMFSSRRIVDFVWLGFVILGLWLLLPLNQTIGGVDLFSAACALAAGACWALYIIFGQKTGVHHGPGAVSVGSLIAACLFCPIGIIDNGMALCSSEVLPFGIAIAILSSVVPFSLEMVALTRLPARTFGTLMSLEPAFGALSGVVFLNEYLTGVQWFGLAAIICASIGATLSIKPKVELQELG